MSDWKKVLNKTDCEITQPVSGSLCYPKNNISNSKISDILFQYRKDRDSKCNPNPLDPCLLSKDNLVLPSAEEIVEYRDIYYMPVSNDAQTANCYIASLSQSYTRSDSSDFNYAYLGENETGPAYLYTDTEGSDYATLGAQNSAVVAFGTYVTYIRSKVKVEDGDPEQRGNAVDPLEFDQAKVNMNKLALAQATSQVDCYIQKTVEAKCPTGRREGDYIYNLIDDGSYTTIATSTESAYIADYKGSDAEDYIPERDNNWNNVNTEYLTPTVTTSAWSKLSCYYGNNATEKVCTLPLYIKKSVVDAIIPAEEAPTFWYAYEEWIKNYSTEDVFTQPGIHANASQFGTCLYTLSDYPAVTVDKDDPSVIVYPKGSDIKYLITIDKLIADPNIQKKLEYHYVDANDEFLVYKSDETGTPYTDIRTSLTTSDEFIPVYCYQQELGGDFLLYLARVPIAKANVVNSGLYALTTKDTTDATQPFNQENATVALKTYTVRADVNNNGIITYREASSAWQEANLMAESAAESALNCYYYNKWYGNNCQTGVYLGEDNTDTCIDSKNNAYVVCQAKDTLISSKSIFDATSQAATIVNSQLLACTLQNLEVRAFCDKSDIPLGVPTSNVIQISDSVTSATFEGLTGVVYVYKNYFEIESYKVGHQLGESGDAYSCCVATADDVSAGAETTTCEHCHAVDNGSLKTYTVQAGMFTSTNPEASVATLTKSAYDLASSSIVCFYGNLASTGISCGDVTNRFGQPVSGATVCSGVSASGCPSGSCAIAVAAQDVEKNIYLGSDPWYADQQAWTVQQAELVCIPCDKVGGGGGTSVSVSSEQNCSNCGNAYCVFI